MSIRLRSALGALGLSGGILIVIGSLVYHNKPVFWTGAACALAGIAIVGWAVRDVSREIGAARMKYETQLRSELEQKHPPGSPD